MLNADEILIEGEEQLGRYQLHIARWSEEGWSPTVPPLNALVTNWRLILRPQTLRPYEPASIPSNYITRVKNANLGPHEGVTITLTTGHQINIFISWSQGEDLPAALETMVGRKPKHHFNPDVAEKDILRLVSFLKTL